MNDDILSLARSRYPDVPPSLAAAFFERDRLDAGFGALAARKRGLTGEVRRSKELDFNSKMVTYRMQNVRPERRFLITPTYRDWRRSLGNMSTTKAIENRVEGVNLIVKIGFYADELKRQSSRSSVAKRLIAARRELANRTKAGL